MRIALTSVLVDDQANALKFYSGVLGFVKSQDLPAGDFRFLTVVSPEGPADVELLLEPNTHPAARIFQQAMFADGIPATSFAVADVHREYERLIALGVEFRTRPTRTGPVLVAVLDDTCGNLIQLHQVVNDPVQSGDWPHQADAAPATERSLQ
jgi:catechol 2,3-dioxygenase-like lactoylglutathione lyase family enzyme